MEIRLVIVSINLKKINMILIMKILKKNRKNKKINKKSSII